ERVVDTVGYSVLGYGRINAWKKAMTVQAVALRRVKAEGDTSSAEGGRTSAILPPQNIMFLDQVDANAQATARFRIPADQEAFLHLVHEYRTPSNFLNTSLIPAFRETLQSTGALMSAEEYFSGGRTEFNTEFENQMGNGIYIVKRKEVVVDDLTARVKGSANVSKGKEQQSYGDGKKVVFRVQRQYDKNGQPLRKGQKFTEFGVQVVDARITDMRPNQKFQTRMELKQQASADRAIAREKRVQEEEQKLLAIAKGEREVAERQAQAKVNQIEKTTNAETQKQLALTKAQQQKEQAEIDKETAQIRLEQAEIDAKAVRVTAEAEAYRKEAILRADNALAQKLEAWVTAQQYWADAFAKRQVPRQVFGSTGGGEGSDTDLQLFMKLMTAKAARDLSLDMEIGKDEEEEEEILHEENNR
ncbi:SPFH domain-containing protein, partial [Magnetococcales bacterium HHB-1]